MNEEELKERARRHELREEWQKAFDLYSTALRVRDEDEPPDITLYNRVGDIQTRMGQINGAVQHYEKAINLYLEAELPNNAIAICKKVLRNLPDRNIFFLRMGQIRASQGFLTDARQNFLTYAERQTSIGDIESALNALIEFVEISPEDLEIRTSLAAQLESHDRTEEAVAQYVEVHRRLILSGAEDEASKIGEKLAILAPDLMLPDADALREEAAESEAEELVLESTSLGGLEFEDWGVDDGAVAEDKAGAVEVPPGELPPSDLDREDAEVVVESGLEDEPETVSSEDLEEEGEPLPWIGYEDEGDDGERSGISSVTEDLPLLDFDDEQGQEEAAPIPGAPDDEREAAREDAAFEAVTEEVAEPETPVDSGDHKEAADRGDMDLAMERVRGLIAQQPDNVELHQRLVEYAFRKNDPDVLVGAYLELAGCLARGGSSLKARAVYQQVLSISPGHEVASRGIQELDGTPGASPPAQVASSEEYVDLGSLVLGDEAEQSTRWTVAADAPTGDEEADFAKMLNQFKEKVSEHVSADDVSAHHDLGTAYMEMGLLDEAIGEFQMALRASPRHLPTHEVMGRCWLDMGRPDMAILALNRALNVPYEVEDELIGIYYLLGRAHQDRGNREEALEFYERVFSLDINFEDVTERLRALR